MKYAFKCRVFDNRQFIAFAPARPYLRDDARQFNFVTDVAEATQFDSVGAALDGLQTYCRITGQWCSGLQLVKIETKMVEQTVETGIE